MPKSLQYTVVNSVQWSTLHCNGQNCTAIANMVQLCCNVLQWSTKVPTTLSQASWSMTPAHFRGTTGRKGEKTIVLAVNAIVVPAIQSLFQQCQHSVNLILQPLKGHLLKWIHSTRSAGKFFRFSLCPGNRATIFAWRKPSEKTTNPKLLGLKMQKAYSMI